MALAELAVEHADRLQEIIEKGREQWPLPQEQPVLRRLEEWAAFRESKSGVLKQLHRDWKHDRSYVVDPLPERIADAFSDLIFGADPEIKAPNESDQEQLDLAVDENDLPSELQEAASISVGEGEVWWRIYVDRDAYDFPVIEWQSRRNVIPLYRGRKVLAVAFVSDLATLEPDASPIMVGDDADPPGTTMWAEGQTTLQDDAQVWRYVEIQAIGLVRNLLYQGTRTSLGVQVDLSNHVETDGLPDEWRHDLDVMLAGRVVNGRGKGRRLGESQYNGIRGLLYALNEAAAIGQENARMTLKKRAVMPMSVAQPNPESGKAKVDISDDIFLSDDGEMGEGGPFKVLEYSFDAQALVTYDDALTDKILTRARMAPQLVGRHTEGAQTGPALRARLIDTTLAANGKSRAWLDQIPVMLRTLLKVMALPEESGGYGYQVANTEDLPSVDLGDVLPEDNLQETQRHSVAVGAEFESRETAVRELHPDWTDEQVTEELDRIKGDQPQLPTLPPIPPLNGNRVGPPADSQPPAN